MMKSKAFYRYYAPALCGTLLAAGYPLWMGITVVSDDWGTGHYFHHDFFMLFNLAVGGNFPGIHDPNGITALPANGQASMYVDYIKVYERQ